MKITIYELLGMIKDGKAPKRIVYKNNCYEWFDDEKDYITETHWLFDEYVITDILNDELEILETTITYHNDILHFTEIENNTENNKIENLSYYDYSDLNMEVITQEECFRRELQHIEKRLTDYHNKINEIINKVNNL